MAAAIAIALWGAAVSAHAGHVFVYRWTDPTSQQVNFGDQAPPNVDAEMFAIEDPPPADAEAVQRLEELGTQVDQWAKEEHRRLMAQQRQAAAAAARGLDCARAQSWREQLDRRPGPRLKLIEVDGTVRRMTEEERQTRIGEVDVQIADLCVGGN